MFAAARQQMRLRKWADPSGRRGLRGGQRGAGRAGGDTAGSTTQVSNEMKSSIMEKIRHLQPFLLVIGYGLIVDGETAETMLKGNH